MKSFIGQALGKAISGDLTCKLLLLAVAAHLFDRHKEDFVVKCKNALDSTAGVKELFKASLALVYPST